ncbi:hypothetical protein QQ045_012697 [Rhodiola kirilowii]
MSQFHYDDPIFKTGFSELEEVLSQFQTGFGSISGSDANRLSCSVDERKQRRMALKRESARRSRWRKKMHLEKLTTELNRLKVQNREFKNQCNSAMRLNQMVCIDNDRLMAQSLVLWTTLCNLSQILLSPIN